jgi:hypothetical protein
VDTTLQNKRRTKPLKSFWPFFAEAIVTNAKGAEP